MMKETMDVLPFVRLDFNIDHPSFEECYMDGYGCAQAELSEGENPFKQGSIESTYWADGWMAGFYGEEPLFDLKNSSEDESVTLTNRAVNDEAYLSPKMNLFLLRFLEISGALAVSAIIGYQLIELVA